MYSAGALPVKLSSAPLRGGQFSAAALGAAGDVRGQRRTLVRKRRRAQRRSRYIRAEGAAENSSVGTSPAPVYRSI